MGCTKKTKTQSNFSYLTLDLIYSDDQRNELKAASGRFRGNKKSPLLKLEDSIDHYFSNYLLDEIDCDFCRSKNTCRFTPKLKSLPRILIMFMKRFDSYGLKLNFDIDFP